MNMTDREFLELSAKAIGDTSEWRRVLNHDLLRADMGDGFEPWNPLTDDGDALRLAVDLEIDIEHAVAHFVRFSSKEFILDKYAATRRAIVRAAAEIGKGME